MMRLTAQGWNRNHGATELFDIDLYEAPAKSGQFTFNRGSPTLGLEFSPHPSARGRIRAITLYCFASIRLGGDYQVRLRISKGEIARLFALTHKEEIETHKSEIAEFFKTFPQEQGDSDDKAA
jgi:hypothetical protein